MEGIQAVYEAENIESTFHPSGDDSDTDIIKFEVHSKTTAPVESKPLLVNSFAAFGMIPNLHGVMAESPAMLEAYQVLRKLFKQTSFNAEELTVIWQTINVEHDCHYCVPEHTVVAHLRQVDSAITKALRNRAVLPKHSLQVLHLTTLALVRNRGHLTTDEILEFFEAGYEKRQLLEIILGISQKVMSNYVNHLAETPLDKAFEKFAWEPYPA